MRHRAVIAGTSIILCMSVIQIMWHMALNLEMPPFSGLRRLYLMGEPRYGRGPWPIADYALPATIAGYCFRRISQAQGGARYLFSISVGVVLSLLNVVYVSVADYELWWLTSGPWPAATLLSLWIVPAFVFCWIGVAAAEMTELKNRISG